MSINLTWEIIDMFALEHTKLRYHAVVTCSDDSPKNGSWLEISHKEWRCKRCCLIEMMDLGVNPSFDKPELVLEVHNWGNVK